MRKRKLYEHDPRDLGFEALAKLHNALIGRLVLVNMALKSRLQEADRGARAGSAASFHLNADELDCFNLVLDRLLVSAQEHPG